MGLQRVGHNRETNTHTHTILKIVYWVKLCNLNYICIGLSTLDSQTTWKILRIHSVCVHFKPHDWRCSKGPQRRGPTVATGVLSGITGYRTSVIERTLEKVKLTHLRKKIMKFCQLQ